jgi:hypothetical protein
LGERGAFNYLVVVVTSRSPDRNRQGVQNFFWYSS